MDEKREIRNTAFQVQVTGEEEEKRTVEGYALLFGVSSDGLSFEEVIDRGALDGVIEKSDVFALLNHNQNREYLPGVQMETDHWRYQSIAKDLSIVLRHLRQHLEMNCWKISAGERLARVLSALMWRKTLGKRKVMVYGNGQSLR
ncbi:Caudovirus prohead protease [Bacteroides cellulosilyticus]|uniref:Caudovirus prohead protease n=1 Tax=Bacteroides cellulosilyticus TaxID=246787 RepID=A0A0P0GGZ1_9BACE|nr:Caudovirus prohead protease [Bacteroides cellulosilyticus]